MHRMYEEEGNYFSLCDQQFYSPTHWFSFCRFTVLFNRTTVDCTSATSLRTTAHMGDDNSVKISFQLKTIVQRERESQTILVSPNLH